MDDYCKILIIDDEYLMRQGLKHMIDWEAEGFTVVGDVSNGQEGLLLIEEKHPHIVLCDIVMPIMDGIDFTAVVHQKYPEIQIIMLSGYDKFDYVRNTMRNGAYDYILKPTLNPEELLHVLNKAAKNIPGLRMEKSRGFQYDKHMERYLLGYDENLDMVEFQKYFTESTYLMALVQIKRYNDKGKDMSALLYGKMEDFAGSFQHGKSLLMLLEEKNACLIINTNSFDLKLAQEGISKLAEQMYLLYDRLLFVKSKPVNDIRQLRNIYNSDMIVNVNRKFYYKNQYMIESEPDVSDKSFEKFDYNKYTQILEQGRYRDAIDMLYRYADGAINGKMDEFKLKNQVQNMLYNLLYTLKAKDKDIESLRQKFFSQIDATSYAEDFRELLNDIKEEISAFIRERRGTENETISKILDYIYEHYNEDLDLAEVARVFNFNYSYLSSYFNQYVSEGFSGYLNGIRVSEACKLLKENDKTIVEISQIVGYSDQSYFSRVFKKVTGMSPMAWRKGNIVR